MPEQEIELHSRLSAFGAPTQRVSTGEVSGDQKAKIDSEPHAAQPAQEIQVSPSPQSVAVKSGYTGIRESTDYKVGPEDLLEIHFLGVDKLNSLVRVDAKGEIMLLLVGDISVGGMTEAEVSRILAKIYKEGDYLRNPHVTVTVKEYRHQKVAVTGAVGKPDHYSLIGPRSLLEVIGMAGGLLDKAGETAHVIRSVGKLQDAQTAPGRQLYSSGTETIVVDLNRLLLHGAVDLNLPIRNGDSVHVPFAQTAHVLGAVARPGSVLIKGNMTVTKAIAQSGGLHILLASSRASILRITETGQRQSLQVDLSLITKGSLEDVALRENDIIFVHESSVRRLLFDFKTLLPGSFGLSIPNMF